jgi:EAL domain-containing protein (putative c-di-GMP-specific phosphodiesterase class I)
MSSGLTVAPRSIGSLIESRGITAHFQPIVSARQRSVMGLEALARGVSGGGAPLSAATLFDMAAEASLTNALERVCCRVAIERFAELARTRPELILFLNLGSWVGANPTRFVAELNQFVERAQLSPTRIAIEILETESESLSQLVAVTDRLRGSGYLLALDDVGVGHSNLDRIALIRPDVVKVDRKLITRIEGDFFKQEALNCLSSLCRKIGALVVAEGVETTDEAIVALELGADLLQGYFFAPASIDGRLARDNGSVADIDLLAQLFKRHMMGKVERRRNQQRQLTTVMDSLLARLAQAVDVEQFEPLLESASGDHDDVECVYVLDGAGTQITSTIVAKYFSGRAGVLFQPAPRGADHSLKEYYYVPREAGLSRYTSEPYVSLASGHLCRTLSMSFQNRHEDPYLLCIDVLC